MNNTSVQQFKIYNMSDDNVMINPFSKDFAPHTGSLSYQNGDTVVSSQIELIRLQTPNNFFKCLDKMVKINGRDFPLILLLSEFQYQGTIVDIIPEKAVNQMEISVEVSRNELMICTLFSKKYENVELPNLLETKKNDNKKYCLVGLKNQMFVKITNRSSKVKTVDLFKHENTEKGLVNVTRLIDESSGKVQKYNLLKVGEDINKSLPFVYNKNIFKKSLNIHQFNSEILRIESDFEIGGDNSFVVDIAPESESLYYFASY